MQLLDLTLITATWFCSQTSPVFFTASYQCNGLLHSLIWYVSSFQGRTLPLVSKSITNKQSIYATTKVTSVGETTKAEPQVEVLNEGIHFPKAIERSHYSDVITGTIASQITSLTIVYLTVYSDAEKTSKFRVTGLCAGNSPGTSEFPAQMASYAENVSIWWRYHVSKVHWDEFYPC